MTQLAGLEIALIEPSVCRLAPPAPCQKSHCPLRLSASVSWIAPLLRPIACRPMPPVRSI
jgi:hypothetical protein